MLWNHNEVQLDLIKKNNQAIHALIKVNPQSLPWILTVVYASPDIDVRKIFWDHIKKFSSAHSFPWLCVGDFNDILFSNEKRGGKGINHVRVSAFQYCLDSSGLFDMGFVGAKFTWINKRFKKGLIFERLDRVICDASWRSLYPEASVFYLVRIRFDYCPILINLDLDASHRDSRPFSCETNSILAVKDVLEDFSLRSGLTINRSKSYVFFSNNVPPDLENLQKNLQLFVVEKVRSKLAGWKANLLLMAGSRAIVQQVASFIPNFCSQCAHLPKSICED
ncbi:hypothetical protein ACH5RR_027424 [Cinchona calisaya]|uniref:Reverse transcriptase n=1 Tax=Cinchona calisaya TaxID=153742 RepID=A0ABD2Z5E5_9GENT